MPKTSSVTELDLEPAPLASVKRRSTARAAEFPVRTAAPPRSVIKPVLIGIGVGAALAGTVFLLRSQRRTRAAAPLISASEPSVTNALLKAALFRLARVAARRAVRAAAVATLYRVAEVWRA